MTGRNRSALRKRLEHAEDRVCPLGNDGRPPMVALTTAAFDVEVLTPGDDVEIEPVEPPGEEPPDEWIEAERAAVRERIDRFEAGEIGPRDGVGCGFLRGSLSLGTVTADGVVELLESGYTVRVPSNDADARSECFTVVHVEPPQVARGDPERPATADATEDTRDETDGRSGAVGDADGAVS